MFKRDLRESDTWCRLHNIAVLVMAGVMLMAAEASAARVLNSFVTIEGDGVIPDGNGGIIRSECASGPVTVTARPGWLVNGRESVSYPSAKGLSGGLKFTSRLGEDHSCCPPPPTSNDVYCRGSAHAEAVADVHELSVERPDYLGLDRTDAMKGELVTRTATAKIDPSPARATYSWTDCGRCAFVGQTSAEAAVYGATDETGGSESYLAEDLTVAATVRNADGLSASATCTTNFTVVAVDVSLGNWGELMDEKNDTVISSYVKRDGTGWFEGYPDLAEEAMTKCPVEIEVLPENLPAEEKVRIAFEDDNLIVNTKPDVANESYGVRKINSQEFYLFNEKGAFTSKIVKPVHEDSSAVDVVKYDVCCCTVTIYSDASELFVDGKWNVIAILSNLTTTPGHSFCKIDVDAEHRKLVSSHLRKYIGIPYGFYPNGAGEEYYDVPSDFHEEDRHYRNVVANMTGSDSHIWHISLEGCIKGLERMYELETVRPNYDLLCFNCTDAAISIGRACGAPVPAGGLPDLSALESIRGGLSGDLDWAQSILKLWKDSDGSYSCPLFLMWNLYKTNVMYGAKE